MFPRYLDKKIKIIWFLPTAITIIILILILGIFLIFFARQPIFGNLDNLYFFLLISFLIVLLIGLPSYLWVHLEYISFTYELTENELIIRYGILTRHTVVIPYLRIQNINSTRTLLERFLGLATLVIETAGTNLSISDATLPGIAKKDLLIKEIMSNVERSKKSSEEKEKFNNSQNNILLDIYKEITKLNQNLEAILLDKKIQKQNKYEEFKTLKR
ncbi:MAG: PH domain-containing protein [Candidatus Omnitrophica bacterium]|nr:PH domain-containing protein [Candidatus Omnitrophota bacterium]